MHTWPPVQERGRCFFYSLTKALIPPERIMIMMVMMISNLDLLTSHNHMGFHICCDLFPEYSLESNLLSGNNCQIQIQIQWKCLTPSLPQLPPRVPFSRNEHRGSSLPVGILQPRVQWSPILLYAHDGGITTKVFCSTKVPAHSSLCSHHALQWAGSPSFEVLRFSVERHPP